MNLYEKLFSLIFRFSVYTVWLSFFIIVFFEEGKLLSNQYISGLVGLALFCIILDIIHFYIKKKNKSFLRDDNCGV